MTTARQIVDGAAEEIGVKTAETTLESADSQVIFDRMNDLLVEWADTGLTPAFNEVADLDDDVNVDRSAIGAVKYALAIRIAPTFQKIITPDLRLLARETLEALERSVIHIGEVALPDTLPTGSGNDCGRIFREDRFFNTNKKVNF